MDEKPKRNENTSSHSGATNSPYLAASYRFLEAWSDHTSLTAMLGVKNTTPSQATQYFTKPPLLVRLISRGAMRPCIEHSPLHTSAMTPKKSKTPHPAPLLENVTAFCLCSIVVCLVLRVVKDVCCQRSVLLSSGGRLSKCICSNSFAVREERSENAFIFCFAVLPSNGGTGATVRKTNHNIREAVWACGRDTAFDSDAFEWQSRAHQTGKT